MQPPASLQLALTTEPSICIDIKKKKEHESSVLETWNCLFCFQHCLARIANVEYQGQTRYTGILEHKPLICTMCTSFAFDIDWIHVYEEHSEIIPEMMFNKVPDEHLKKDNMETLESNLFPKQNTCLCWNQ